MSKGKILKRYISPIDQFINEFDKEHPKLSKSQKKEIEKYRRVFRLRDEPNTIAKTENTLPEGF